MHVYPDSRSEPSKQSAVGYRCLFGRYNHLSPFWTSTMAGNIGKFVCRGAVAMGFDHGRATARVLNAFLLRADGSGDRLGGWRNISIALMLRSVSNISDVSRIERNFRQLTSRVHLPGKREVVLPDASVYATWSIRLRSGVPITTVAPSCR
jgi:hypothetical protein